MPTPPPSHTHVRARASLAGPATGAPGAELHPAGARRRAPSASPRRNPVPRDHAEAGRSANAAMRMVAHALDMLTAVVPAGVAAFSPVDAQLRAFATDPVVVRREPPPALDAERMLRAYANGYHLEDPFAPRRWAESDATVVGADDVGGDDALARSPFGRGFLASHGLASAAALYVRAGRRPVAIVVLARGAGLPAIAGPELGLLRTVQPAVEETVLLACEAGKVVTSEPHADGLTPREAEVAALVAGGASNAEVARELAIRPNTVREHVRHVLAKLELRSRSELPLWIDRDWPPARSD